MNDTVQIDRFLAEHALDALIELRGERDWWKDEPRCDYQARYYQLCRDINALETALGGPKPEKPTP